MQMFAGVMGVVIEARKRSGHVTEEVVEFSSFFEVFYYFFLF